MIIKIIIHGRVQGVGFRYWARQRIEELGITGEVWNNDDGTVGAEITAGSDPKVQRLIELLKTGPALAKVEKITIIK